MHNGATVLEPECTVRAHLTRGVRQVLIQWIGEPPSSATWEDLEGFADRYPSFQLEDELLIEGGGRCHVGPPVSAACPRAQRRWLGRAGAGNNQWLKFRRFVSLFPN